MSPKEGVGCSLVPEPQINYEEECPKFSIDSKELKYRKELLEDAADVDDETKINKHWYLITLLVPIVIALFSLLRKDDLNSDYRWTITEAYKLEESFGLQSSFKSHMKCRYSIEGKEYQITVDLPYYHSDEEAIKGYYFLRYNPDDPSNAEVPEFEFIPKYIDPSNIPSNGIHKDSLESFARDQLEVYKNPSNKINFKYSILSLAEEELRDVASDYQKTWTPDTSDILIAERLIKSAVSNTQGHILTVETLSNYFRQYVGFRNSSNERVIWVNALCEILKRTIEKDGQYLLEPWNINEEIISVDDGGDCYWNVFINIDKQEHYKLSINGI